MSFRLWPRGTNFSLILDWGSEAAKALLIRKIKERPNKSYLQPVEKTDILDSYLRYFDYNESKSGYLEIAKEVCQRFGKKPKKITLGLPPSIMKVRVSRQSWQREKPKKVIDYKEEREIEQSVLRLAERETVRSLSKSSGILAGEFQFNNSKIINVKIDGYGVSAMRGYEGKHIDLEILVVCLLKGELAHLKKFFKQAGFKNIKFVHIVEGLSFYFKDYPNAIFLDIGGETTQIIRIKAGSMEAVDEFERGAKFFSQAISEKLGLRKEEARILKERYANQELSEDSRERIKEIFYSPVRSWFAGLKSKLKEMSKSGLFPPDIILLGGGSKLPDIKQILEESDWENIYFSEKPKVRVLMPDDLKNINDGKNLLTSPQQIPALLMAL